MHIDFHGKLTPAPQIRAAFIGCGSHSFRNVYPALQFAPVDLVAVCDLDIEKARAFAKTFGAENAYSDYRDMLSAESLDAVFIVTGYDEDLRPLYPQIASDCLAASLNVWTEKPLAATSAEILSLKAAAEKARKHVLVGLKKMFFPVNRKLKSLISHPDFGRPSLATIQYPQRVPTADEFARYLDRREAVPSVFSFLDHLCHPASLMVYLFGMPATLHYERSHSGSALATFTFDSGLVCSVALTAGAATTAGLERTLVVSDSGRHVVADNNIRLFYHRTPPEPKGQTYGSQPDFFTGAPTETSSFWEPEFSLGQLYNKGLFLLGYYDEVNEFARAVLDDRPPSRGTLDHALAVTRIFEAFRHGPSRTIPLP